MEGGGLRGKGDYVGEWGMWGRGYVGGGVVRMA